MPASNRNDSISLGVILAVLAASGFSLKAIFVKQAYLLAPVDPVTLLSLRMLFALPFFLIVSFTALKNIGKLTIREIFTLVCVGLAGYYGASILDFMGLQYITAGLERIILFSYPILTILIGIVFLHQPFEKRLILPVLLCFLGVACACASDLSMSSANEAIALGVLLVAGSAVCYAFYQAFSEPMIKRLGAKPFSVLAMLISIFAVQLHFFSQLPLSALNQPGDVYWLCFMMAVLSTVLPVFLQSSAISRIGAARMSLISTLGPMLTIVFGWLILDEQITLMQITGMVLVLSGIMLIRGKQTKKNTV
ncbi:DMT family transporter [Alteromonas lipolytica]|uniref:Multidrug DMT transporter permease n=1 Tax=Alteromonas lipolytica TaxID=1856405 RepID=A0A1E8FIV9_9ALTE|nr:DMT family transporter [Alteromonas lipolytica]OFI35855.1 multidrug DMT transporter permease [Alteromonas lipolytica]GGF81416.1 permease [Alteromonas lipolytica]